MEATEHPDQVIVLLEEEYGYRNWIWYTGMSETELIEWWKNLRSVDPYFFTPVGLPGTLTEIESDEDEAEAEALKTTWRGHIHEDEDSFLFQDEHGYIHHKGYIKLILSGTDD